MMHKWLKRTQDCSCFLCVHNYIYGFVNALRYTCIVCLFVCFFFFVYFETSFNLFVL